MALTIEQQFRQFHAANPDVLQRLLDLARPLQAADSARISIKMLFEILRYEHALWTTGDRFKLNNNFHSRYVRLIQEIDPDLGELFETRALLTA